MVRFIKNLKNKIDFFLRKKFSFSRKNYFEKNESKEGLLTNPKILEKEYELSKEYSLSYLKNHSSKQNYLENLYLLDILDQILKPKLKNKLKVLDIGSKNWFYAKGEYFFFKKYCENLFLDGVEIDSKRLYSNFFTRGEVAKFHIKDLENTRYIESDFLNHKEKYDYIIWILPFIIEEPLLKWGLPLEYFKPEEMLLHARKSLKEEGKLFIINQGEAEYNAQKELCEKLNINYKELREIKSDFLRYKNKRFAVLIEN